VPGPGLRLRRLHGVGQGLVEVAVVSHRGVPVLARDEVLFGDGDDEGAGVAVEGGGAEEVEALRVFFFGGARKRRKKKVSEAVFVGFLFPLSLSLSLSPLFSSSPLLQLFHDRTKRLADRDSLKLTQEEYDRPPLVAILQVALACLCCAWASVRAAGPLRRLAPAANQAPLAGTPFRGAAWMTLGHRGMAAPARVAVVKPEGGRSF